MNQHISPGSCVTWTSRGPGRQLKQTGIVLAFVPAGESLFKDHPDIMASTRRRLRAYSQNDRYLVQVREKATRTNPAYYAPIAAWVETAVGDD